jgi:hypothetical protein
MVGVRGLVCSDVHAQVQDDSREEAVKVTVQSSPAPRALRAACAALVCGLLGAAAAPVPPASAAAACPNEQFRTGPSAGLPDCRAYEQVSPVEKDGADAFTPIYPLPAEVSAVKGSAEGSSIAYQTLGAFSGPPSHLLGNAYLAIRTAGGWQTSSLTPPTLGPIPTSGEAALAGYSFSADLSRVVIGVPWQALAPGAPTLLENLFLRGPDGSYSLLTTAPPEVPVPESCVLCYKERDIPAFAGASSDYTHVLFEANESLAPGAPGGGIANLYESDEALPGESREVRLVGVLPDGAIPAEGSMPGAGLEDNYVNHYDAGDLRDESGDIRNAISADGSHVVFSAKADGGIPDSAQKGFTELYDRVRGSATTEISAPAPGATPANPAAEPAQFWTASAEGALVFFTSSAELTSQSRTGVIEEENEPGEITIKQRFEDLYEYNVGTKTLTDLTVDDLDPMGANVRGVVGASEDGSYVYFVATGKLTGDAADGQPNLYVAHEGGPPRFIATLNEEDSEDWTATPSFSSAYVAPDGRHLAFASINSLTGYDNDDLNSGQPDSEVYEYSAEGGSLVCASCEPSGVRPVGNAFTGAGARGTKKIGTALYQPRMLSDDGSRLFFSAPARSLVSGVGAGSVKVFEYEQDGNGSCAQAGGCVYSISSSAANANDVFLDASPSGNDVFFATYDQLVSGDQDNLMDIYDARVEGGFPSVPPTPAPCATSAACQVHGMPPSLPPVGSSALSVGASNLPAPVPSKSKKTAAQIRAEKLVRALKACHSKRNERKRADCEAEARRQYARARAKARKAGRDRRAVR